MSGIRLAYRIRRAEESPEIDPHICKKFVDSVGMAASAYMRGHDWPAPGTARGWRGSPEQGKPSGQIRKVLGL